ncbi:MAG: hypothetical protein ACYCV0_02555 [Desulfitobacteriaceae bacterium]
MNIGQEIEECPYCLAIHSLKYECMATVWRWDLELPDDWQFPQWESVRLFPIQVNQTVLRCNQCGELIKVIPSFIQHGTTLTLPALIFVALAYEFSDLTWRDLPQKFCDEDNRIAHSTLYKAVHGLGRLIHSDSEFRKLCQQYLPSISAIPRWSIPHWPPPKSIYTHTVIREKGVRSLIRSLWPYYHYLSEVFDRFVISLEHVFVNSSKAIPVLYKKGWREEDTAVNTS